MIIIINRPQKLNGELTVPGDKSITHRALIIGSLAHGITEIEGFLDADDCRSTLNCLRALGVKITESPGLLLVEGRDMNLEKPAVTLDAGNSGTTARLLLGVLAGQPFETVITGDDSLRKRPMNRVIKPLSLMGASIRGTDGLLPLTVSEGRIRGINYSSPRASAQVKSAVLLAALFNAEETKFIEPYLSRDHTELMLAEFGAGISNKESTVLLRGGKRLEGCRIKVPGDISTAAFFMVAAAIIPGAEVYLKDVGINPTRSGIIDVLLEMGADLEIRDKRLWGREPVADIFVRGGPALKGTIIDGETIPKLIDEIPVIAVAASVADGITTIKNAGELRVKETDRLAAIEQELTRLGAVISSGGDDLSIQGNTRFMGAKVHSYGDHRMAMALAVAGLAAEGDTVINGAEAVSISYPHFMQDLRKLIAD